MRLLKFSSLNTSQFIIASVDVSFGVRFSDASINNMFSFFRRSKSCTLISARRHESWVSRSVECFSFFFRGTPDNFLNFHRGNFKFLILSLSLSIEWKSFPTAVIIVENNWWWGNDDETLMTAKVIHNTLWN